MICTYFRTKFDHRVSHICSTRPWLTERAACQPLPNSPGRAGPGPCIAAPVLRCMCRRIEYYYTSHHLFRRITPESLALHPALTPRPRVTRAASAHATRPRPHRPVPTRPPESPSPLRTRSINPAGYGTRTAPGAAPPH